MPVDGSGNFTRSYSWAGDKAGGIKIIASRMDGEFDNYAAALNQTFWRTGIVGMTGALNMGGNAINSVADGTAGTPGIRFVSDGTSGIFLPSVGKVALAAGGVNRLEANSTGVSVNGTLNSNGTATFPALVASTFNVSGTTSLFTTNVSGNLAVTGATTIAGLTSTNGSFTGTLGVSGVTTLNGTLLLGNSGFVFSSDGAQDTGWRWISDGVMAGRANGVDRLTVDTTGVSVTGALAVSGLATVGGAATFSGAATVGGSLTVQNTSNLRGTAYFGATSHGSADADATTLFLRGNNIAFQDGAASATRMYISSSGYVGIGTTGPASTLHVFGNNGTFGTSAFFGLNSGVPGIGIGHSGAIGVIQGHAAANSSTTANLAMQLSGGNVGIGLANPSQKLHVQGNVQVTPPSGWSAGQTAVAYLGDANNYISATNGAGATVQGFGGVTLAAQGLELLYLNTFGGISSPNLADAVGYKGLPQDAEGGSFTFDLTQIGKHVLLSGAGSTCTIPTNATVAFQVGSAITVVNAGSAAKTIAPAGGVTLKWAGVGSTGNRTLAVDGVATLIKTATDTWYISGAGIS